MINITNKVDCCGCQACGDICGKKAISFKTDEEGIWYPAVDKDKCVDCGLCEKVCPIINKVCKPDNSNSPVTYVLQAPNPIDRLNSASGAAYTLLVRAVFKRGGYVAGHIWDTNFSIKGYISCEPKDLSLLQSTKYLQSNIEGMYKAIKELLNQGKYVFFSGCPCQNAAMRSYLRKEYDNLIMADFTCMGIDSPLAFKKYIESLENQYHSKMVYFKAKSKEVGWRYLTNKAVFENGKSYFGINGRDANLNATFLNVLVRPSCYDCKFKGFPRVSDMTIGDYWRKSYDSDDLDDNTGTSYVMLHNKKAEELFNDVLPQCNYRKIDYTDILGANPLAMQSLTPPKFDRSVFYKRLHQEDFGELVSEYYNRQKEVAQTGVRKLKRLIKIILASAYFNRSHPVSFLRMMHYNFFDKRVTCSWAKGDLLIIRNARLILGKDSSLSIKGHCIIDSKHKSSDFSIGDKATLRMDNNIFGEGLDCTLDAGASLSLGFKTIVKNNVTINVTSQVSIDEFCLIDDGAIIDDADNGIVYFENNQNDKNISLGTHTLISRGAIIKEETILGDEVIVREHSVVKGVFPSQSVISGAPAKLEDKDIKWKYNFDNIWNFKN